MDNYFLLLVVAVVAAVAIGAGAVLLFNQGNSCAGVSDFSLWLANRDIFNAVTKSQEYTLFDNSYSQNCIKIIERNGSSATVQLVHEKAVLSLYVYGNEVSFRDLKCSDGKTFVTKQEVENAILLRKCK